MENNNASATPVAPVTPTSSTPTQSSVNATAPVSKKDNKKAIIIACIVIGVCILVSVVFTLISHASAQRRVDETAKICKENGILSTKCKEAQTKNKVTCDIITDECVTKAHTFLIF
jgi:hypothetical protein